MLENKVLIRKLVAIDGFSTRSIVVGEVPSLAHELGNDTVEGRSSITEALLSSAQGAEVFGSFGDYICPELHYDTSGWSASDADVKVYLWVGPVS